MENKYVEFDDVLNFLSKNIIIIKESRTDIIARCPFCGDSSKSNNVGHFYISKQYPIYRCFRGCCEEKGHVNKLLRLLNCPSNIKINSNYTINTPKKVKLYDNQKIIKFPDLNLINQNQIEYLNNRTKRNDMKDLIQHLPYICDLEKFIYDNIENPIDFLKINNITSYFNFKNFVTFYTYNKHKLICRNIINNNFRYKIIDINKEEEDFIIFTKFTKKELICKKELTVAMGEGMFDILNPFTYNMFPDVDLYIASTGCGKFILCLRYIIKLFMTKINLKLLLDSNFYENLRKKFHKIATSYTNTIEYYYNSIGKDFGDFPISIYKI